MPPCFLFTSLLPGEVLVGEDTETFSDEVVEAVVGEVVKTVRCTFEEEHRNGEGAVRPKAPWIDARRFGDVLALVTCRSLLRSPPEIGSEVRSWSLSASTSFSEWTSSPASFVSHFVTVAPRVASS